MFHACVERFDVTGNLEYFCFRGPIDRATGDEYTNNPRNFFSQKHEN